MSTLYDWITVTLFAGLVVLFLQRSDREAAPSDAPNDALWQYLVAAVGCALVNWIGNGGRHVAAIAVLSGLLVFIAMVLKPWPFRG